MGHYCSQARGGGGRLGNYLVCCLGRSVGNTCGDANQYGRAHHAREGAHHGYDPVCRELAGSILHIPSCSAHRTPTLSPRSRNHRGKMA
jgi:hypothetical protein